MSEIVIELNPAEVVAGKNVTKLNLASPKVKHLRELKNLEGVEAELKLIELLANISPEDLDNFSLGNLQKISAELKNFLSPAGITAAKN